MAPVSSSLALPKSHRMAPPVRHGQAGLGQEPAVRATAWLRPSHPTPPHPKESVSTPPKKIVSIGRASRPAPPVVSPRRSSSASGPRSHCAFATVWRAATAETCARGPPTRSPARGACRRPCLPRPLLRPGHGQIAHSIDDASPECRPRDEILHPAPT